jgi:hypothetical protein
VRHPKLVSLALMLAVFGCVGGIAWAVTNSHARIEIPIKEQMRETPTPMYGSVSIPNVAAWHDGWKNECITENYAFAFYSSIC